MSTDSTNPSPRGTDPVPPGQSVRADLKVQHYGPVPRVGAAGWAMTFMNCDPPRTPAGPAQNRQLEVSALADLPRVTVTADLHCASRWTARGLVWEGVPTSTLLDRFPAPPGTVSVLVYGEYGYSANVRLEDLRMPTSLLATRLDGAALAPEHGFPVRLVVPHLYAYKGPKWFRGWEYLTSARRGFWEERGYHLVGDPWAEQRYSYQE